MQRSITWASLTSQRRSTRESPAAKDSSRSIARALAQDAPLIVIDEPTASLDFGNQVRVLAEIERLKASGVGVLLSTHDPDQALQLAVGSRAFCTRFVFTVRDLAMQIGRQWDFPESLTSALARDAVAAQAPLAALVNACGIVSRMRMLVDAGQFTRDDAVLAIGSDERIAACFDALAPKAAIEPE